MILIERTRSLRNGYHCQLAKAILVAVVICSNFQIVASINVKECFPGKESDPLGNVTLTCPENYIINIDEALLGRNKWGTCLITAEDCVDKTRIFQSCEDLNNCTRTFKTYTPACGYSTTLILSYRCEISLAALIQASSTTTTTTTIITTPIFVQNFIEKQEERTIETSNVNNEDKESKTDDAKEIGLIVGCVVASIVTVVALIIAIIMVIRRLCLPQDKNDDEESRNCVICICFKDRKAASDTGESKNMSKETPLTSCPTSAKKSTNIQIEPVDQQGDSVKPEVRNGTASTKTSSNKQNDYQNISQYPTMENISPGLKRKRSSLKQNSFIDSTNNNNEKSNKWQKDTDLSDNIKPQLDHPQESSVEKSFKGANDHKGSQRRSVKLDAIPVLNTVQGTQC